MLVDTSDQAIGFTWAGFQLSLRIFQPLMLCTLCDEFKFNGTWAFLNFPVLAMSLLHYKRGGKLVLIVLRSLVCRLRELM